MMHVLNELRDIGNGIVNMTVDLACAQAMAGHSVQIVSGGGGYVELVESRGVRHIQVYPRRRLRPLVKAISDLGRAVDEFRPDIVHVHMVTGLVLARALQLKSKFILVSTVHNEYNRSSSLMLLADACVAVSGAVATSLQTRGLRRSRIRTIPNGTVGGFRSELPVAAATLNRPAVVSIGAVSQRKGTDLLVRAFSAIAGNHPRANLYVVGNVDWSHPRALAEESAAHDRIHFVGFRSNPKSYLQQADLFVLCSRRDPYPLAVLEAREAGVPILASNVDGIPEALEWGARGVLFETESLAQLSSQMDTLLSDTQLRTKWARAASQNLEGLGVRRMADDYAALYRELEARRRR